jgi:hypothetical protein
LSTYEISARLAAEGTPLNRTSVGEILAGEGFGRLVRGPQPAGSISPATRAGTHACPGRRSSTLAPGRGSWSPRGLGCCWCSLTW